MEIVNGLSLEGFLEILQQLGTMIYGAANSIFKLFLFDLRIFGVPIGILFSTLALLSAICYTLLNSSSD